jgi:RNA polymerase sigma factor (TIGR02999 family)
MQEGATGSPLPETLQPAGEQLLSEVYNQLRAIAQQRLAMEAPGHTLQATALVHEAYLKLRNHDSIFVSDKPRFVLAAAEAMRRILIDHARTRSRVKRGGPNIKRTMVDVGDVADLAADHDPDRIIALDEAIGRLDQMDAQSARVVKLRFYAGLSIDETADAIGISPQKVKRDWQFARAWLFRALQ